MGRALGFRQLRGAFGTPLVVMVRISPVTVGSRWYIIRIKNVPEGLLRAEAVNLAVCNDLVRRVLVLPDFLAESLFC